MKLKIILSIITIALVHTASAQRVKRKGVVVKNDNPQTTESAWYKIEELKGNWKEIERDALDGKNISYTDTAMLKINGANSITKIMSSMNLDLKGAAMIEAPNYLNIAADRYTIEKHGQNNLTLSNDAGRHIFLKVKDFPEGIVYNNVKPDELQTVTSIDPAMLQGKWEVYRKDAEPGYITESTLLIKNFTISSSSDRIAQGEVEVYDGKNIINTLTATFKFEEGNMIILMPEQTLNLNVFEANENALVFGKKGQVINYARKK